MAYTFSPTDSKKFNIKIVRHTLIPAVDGTLATEDATEGFDLGSSTKRFSEVHTRSMHTGDLHLKNDKGDWSIIEEEDYLSITNNKTGKKYKFVLEEVED